MTTPTKRWVIAPAIPGLNPLAQVLAQRGYTDAASIRHFLHPQLRQLGDPLALPAMTAAVDRILAGIHNRERIVIYGDYDVDGVTASALLTRVLRAVGADVRNFLPHRQDEGYGLSADGLARCRQEHDPQLLIAVDCGTSSIAEIAGLKRDGVDVIVLDHHEPGAELPDCVALVNPKLVERASSPLPGNRENGLEARSTAHTPFASVGVAFKVAHALLKANRQWNVDLREHLDLVALGTVADVVPLTGENRILVKAGLARIQQTGKVGLRALADVAGVDGPVQPHHIGFRLGPRLNAAGRLADAMAALELLLTEDRGRAAELAQLLHEHNAARQKIEEQMVGEALAQAEQLAGDRILVLADPGWHAGVIGIVAARVLQAFYRPTVVIGAEGKGSCRSVNGFSIVAALRSCEGLMERCGGHEMAAGLTIMPGNIAKLRAALNEYAARKLPAELLLPAVNVDAVARLDDLDDEFFRELEQFEPCGAGNPTPCFAVMGVRLAGAPRLLKEKHWKFRVTDGEMTHEAVWWNAGGETLPDGELDVAFVPELNEFRGDVGVQLRVRDIRPSHPPERD
jgi:single-stranded-DNA-specific exonuclease